MKMTKVLVTILCCFVPSRKKRKEIRNRLVKSKERRERLVDYGVTIEGDVAITEGMLKLDISDYAKACNHIKEIVVDEAYNLSCQEDCVVIDIGMNRAIASLFFAGKENVKQVYAFEPFQPTLLLAQKNLDLNPEISKKIQVFACGLGRADATLEIPYSISVSDCMSTTHAVSVKQNVRNETVVVKDAARVLGAIFEENKSRRVIVKCDCEGAEYEIMERLNDKGLIAGMDAVLMEYHFQKPDRLVRVLTEAGFAVHVIHGSKREPITGYLYAARMQAMSEVEAT